MRHAKKSALRHLIQSINQSIKAAQHKSFLQNSEKNVFGYQFLLFFRCQYCDNGLETSGHCVPNPEQDYETCLKNVMFKS